MFTLTGFVDEISDDLREQLEGLKELGIRHLELRNVWGKNVMVLTEEDITKLKGLLVEYECSVSSIASPIGKYPIGDDFTQQVRGMERAIELAQKLDSSYIRVFSYYIPKGEDPVNYREEVIHHMGQLAKLAEVGGVTLILENDNGGLYGDRDDRVLGIVQTVNSPALKLAFDPGNFVLANVAPVSQAYVKLAPFIGYIHIKDADSAQGMFVEAGRGDGEITELLRRLKQSSFSGFLSIEPHLHKAYPAASNPERFAIAAKALQNLLSELQYKWN
jgi:sugar phosphate isomerase/epimerase